MRGARRNLPAIEVAVAIVRDADGRVLVTERLPRQLSPGYWELPGGKIEPGEIPAQAAAREAAEEVGVQVEALTLFTRYEHRFPLRRLRLHFFLARRWRGTPHGREGQRIAWIQPHAPEVAPLLPSNRRVLQLLGLPSEGLMAHAELMADPVRLRRLSGSGRQLLVADARRAAAGTIQRLAGCAKQRRVLGHSLWLAGPVHHAAWAGAEGLLSCGAARCWLARPDVPLWAVNCADATDAELYARLGADVGLFEAGAWSEATLAASARHFAAAYLIVDDAGSNEAAHLTSARALASRLQLQGLIRRTV
jgi:8-oxo-dGTP diphosphatase